MTRRELLPICTAAGLFGDRLVAAPLTRKTKHLVLITCDGLRWQELFTGIDSVLMNEKSAGMEDDAGVALRTQLWRETAEERRRALMPFFWDTLAHIGVVLGNVTKGSSVQVTNRYRVSYPGYSEILTGRSQDDVIRGNDPLQNPTPSFLEFLKHHWGLPKEQAAVFASWETFRFISESKRGDIFVNAGYEDANWPGNSARVSDLNRLQKQARFIESSARHDAFTFYLAVEYLKTVQPKLLYIAFDETDDWAHHKRYDGVLEAIQFVDGALGELWKWLQSSPTYRDSTTLIVTSDHGRGATKDDWNNHGPKVPGDEQIWIAVIGPDTPALGELVKSEDFYQRDVAPTALELLGVDYRGYAGVQGKPIEIAYRLK